MHILIVTPFYLPDGGPAAPLSTMLSEELVKRGNHVTVIAAVPHYPTGIVRPDFRYKHPVETKENGVNVIRVPLPSVNRANLFQRLVQLFIFQIRATLSGINKEYDVILLNNPFFMTGIPLFILGVVKRKPLVYAVYDVYPDIGIQTGIFRNRLIIQWVTTFEKYCLKKATLIRILSKSFIPAIMRMDIPENKIRLIYDWVDLKLIKPLPKENDFSNEYGLSDKFIVLYAGNIGLSQGLEIVLDTAARFISQPEIRFVLVGDGAGKVDLMSEAQKMGLPNVQFVPLQPRERLMQVLASASVALIVLKKGAGFGSLPSKTYSIMASGKPIIACLDEGCEARELIERAQAGICVDPENTEQLAEAIIKLRSDAQLCLAYGMKGRKYVEEFHSPQKAAEHFEDLFIECIELFEKQNTR